MMGVRTMFQVGLVVLALSFIQITAELACPPQIGVCSCSQSVQWWDDRWTNVTIVNCTNLLLKRVPDLSSMQGRPFHRLLLNDNNIGVFGEEDFANLTVREIDLGNNRIKKIPNFTFATLRNKLEYLSLERNQIRVDKGLQFLKGLRRLKYLNLGHNLVADRYKEKELPGNLFRNLNLTSLQTLTLQTMRMSRLMEGSFIGIEHLEQLDLSYNFLPEFPEEIRKLTNLRGLKLYSNEILKLKNDTFRDLNNLRQLLVGVNDIKIEVGAFNGLEDSIEEINLYHNILNRIPTEAIQNLRNLKRLSLVKTRLESIENGSFVGDYNLEELHLDDNPKLNFSDAGMFHGIEDSLKILHISRLGLTKLPVHVLERLPNLTRLDATSNSIERIDKHFFKHLTLTEILLGWNNITHVHHRAFKHFPKGVILNLNQNFINNISFILDVEECTFRKVALFGNRIPCDCDLEKVINSGVVSWGVQGNCHVRSDGLDTWYDFADPALARYFKDTCETTKPYASCFPVRAATSGASRVYSPLKSGHSVLFVGFIYLCLPLSYLR